MDPSPQAPIPFCRQLPSWGFARALGPSWQGSRSSKTHLLAVVLTTRARLTGRERLAEGSAAGRVKPLLPANGCDSSIPCVFRGKRPFLARRTPELPSCAHAFCLNGGVFPRN